mmetsp:Transcript_126644/g.358206  ORF Transcript_126644/g.358206 Transcript_126644/m.358206 type:complete len:229 (+) Transcript_126644:179-865(+)
MWSSSNASLICLNSSSCVMYGSILSSPAMYRSTSMGTCGFDFQPPNAVPFHERPVTIWKGLVEISLPAAATPMTTETPQPRAEASSADRITSTLPVQSKEKSTPKPVIPTMWACTDVPSGSSLGLTTSVAPHCFASSSLAGSRSTQMILEAPALTRPSTTLRPTAPMPNTAAVAPRGTLAVFHTAPQPVEMPQPRRHTFSRGASLRTLARDCAWSTLYSAKELVPMKW